MENDESIFYLDHPHFTVGHVDQWGEQGYLLFEGMVYEYEENRKDQCGSTTSPRTTDDFLSHAEREGLTVPQTFLETLADASRSRTREKS